MNLDAIPVGKSLPNDVNVVVEISIGGEPIKYKMDKAAGTLVVDRFLYTPTKASFAPLGKSACFRAKAALTSWVWRRRCRGTSRSA
jgi:hypothetical protein